MKIYAIRHGETDQGKNRIIANLSESLNHNGIAQAIRVGKELRNLNIDVIYCSPIERAKHTLKLLNLDYNIPVVIDDRLKERDMGIYEKVSFDDLDWEKFWSYNSDLKYSKLEPMKNVYERVSDFLNEIRVQKYNKNILIVTHGGVIRAIHWYFNGIDNFLFTCQNCKIYEYEM